MPDAVRGSSMLADAGISGAVCEAGGVLREPYPGYAPQIGLARAHLQHVLTSAVLNLMRAVVWLTETPRAKTRLSRFAALLAVS